MKVQNLNRRVSIQKANEKTESVKQRAKRKRSRRSRNKSQEAIEFHSQIKLLKLKENSRKQD